MNMEWPYQLKTNTPQRWGPYLSPSVTRRCGMVTGVYEDKETLMCTSLPPVWDSDYACHSEEQAVHFVKHSQPWHSQALPSGSDWLVTHTGWAWVAIINSIAQVRRWETAQHRGPIQVLFIHKLEIFLVGLFCGTGAGTQGFSQAKQVLCHWNILLALMMVL